MRFSGKFIVDGCESWSKGTANGCSCVDGKHVLDVVWDETPGEVATCSIGDPDDELVLLQRMKPQAGLTRKDLRPAVLLSSGEDVTVMTTTLRICYARCSRGRDRPSWMTWAASPGRTARLGTAREVA